MRKNLKGEHLTKAKKREIKNRPRMKMHGRSLKTPAPHGGKKISSR